MSKKNGLVDKWIGTCHQNLVSIHLTVTEKTMSTDGRMRHDSSFAVQ